MHAYWYNIDTKIKDINAFDVRHWENYGENWNFPCGWWHCSSLREFPSLCCFSAMQAPNELRLIAYSKAAQYLDMNKQKHLYQMLKTTAFALAAYATSSLFFLNHSLLTTIIKQLCLRKILIFWHCSPTRNKNRNFVNTLLMMSIKILGRLSYLHIKTHQQVQSIMKT